MKNSQLLWVSIAGEMYPVLFDGEMVSTPEFPDIPIDYISPCGTRITQALMVMICKQKMEFITA
jgi:hypothetical protein